MMTIVKARKQGNSVAVTLPSELGITVGQEFLAIKKNNSLIFTPKLNNPFDKLKENELIDEQEVVVEDIIDD
ncbi:type II toxin-antitoxin system PemI/MazE family antitoxin [Leuconostoc pseudomesenteroides]|uniref:type II toxin-antitoxin system PemI/MazE family antitoxin n=1 Tax=Leuconostoc pseudomesenteroides TaxID=33968 RepID=UPI00111E248D|nr:AbrB family transcriptional regulator [Leuconostoc pseudomesenteroides]